MSVVALRPGLLVSLSVRMSGGIEYKRVELDAEKPLDDSVKVEKWETTKVVSNPEEHERATKVRGKCGSLIRSVCTRSAFGLLCLAAQEKALDEAIAEARKLATEFNAGASTVQIGVYVLKGRIAESDNEAARAIVQEMRDLLDAMRGGIRAGDVERVREAASQAKKIAAMLDDESAKKVNAAVTDARDIAKTIVKLSEDAPESVPTYTENVDLRALDAKRFAFLDLDGEETTVAPAQASAPVLDLDA